MSLTPQMIRYQTCLMCGGPVPAGVPCPACIAGEPLDGARFTIVAPADIAQQIAAAVKAERERIAAWHDREAAGAMNSLHCGSENGEYRAANRAHDFHKAAASSIRALAAQEGGE